MLAMDEEEAELRNPFPSPPSHYTNYTSHNLQLLALLKERVSDADLPAENEHHILSDQTNLPPWALAQLEKPRVDWIIEDGYYNVFGDTWFTKETIPSLAELGGNQLYPADPGVDRRPALLSILRSMLLTYSMLTTSLLAPPPTVSSAATPDWQRHVEWITVLAQNIMAAANDLRPVQARGNLELMMRRQLELRQEETKILHARCDALESKLAEVRATVLKVANPSLNRATDMDHSSHNFQGVVEAALDTPSTLSAVTVEHVLRWAEEMD